MTEAERGLKPRSAWATAGLWALALLITLASAVYQRITGPTHPIKGTIDLGRSWVEYDLERTHGGPGDQPVTLVSGPQDAARADLFWRRYPMGTDWTRKPMERQDMFLVGHLPHQPPAGKIEYYVIVRVGREEARLPAPGESAITRFKGAVPPGVLIPHIIAMFVGMLVANRAGLEALRPDPSRSWLQGFIAAALLFAGGLVLGPIVQKFAFGEFWTGFPFGTDLTDNKTLIAMLGWGAALVFGRRGKGLRWWILGAALLTLAIFLIPHSMFGSELQQ